MEESLRPSTSFPDVLVEHSHHYVNWLKNDPLAQKLSRRELQVLEGLSKGKSNKEIARDLDLQEPTIKLHVKTLYRKIGAANRTQAALIAKEEGLF